MNFKNELKKNIKWKKMIKKWFLKKEGLINSFLKTRRINVSNFKLVRISPNENTLYILSNQPYYWLPVAPLFFLCNF